MNLTNPHNLAASAPLNHVLETDLITVYYYDNIVVAEAREGVTLSYKTGFSILVKGLRHINMKSFVYISNRINSYALNPNDYVYLEKIPTLKGIGIVAPTEIGKNNAELELKFFNKPMEIFDSVPDAFHWGKEILHSQKG
ncbi:hypothetical protein J1N09_11285 [Aureitalea sp. L0-47]|uniref:hypothetical protein n=1 Tax=Aureitalea sp. L0-47 TaxID=2816962 RepID=UPI00223738D4|nr:hypothetical protein [Aureitalea sp. L0-47]MCW5520427.1 hypothetical protein [Aureitalea sp. L0-47]